MGRGKSTGKGPQKMEGYFEKKKCDLMINVVWLRHVISFKYIRPTQLNRDNLIRAFQVAFEQTRETTEALVNEIQTIKEQELATIRSPNSQITLQPSEVTNILCQEMPRF